MITGIHGLLYSSEPEALRAVLRDAFGWQHVDAGGGWLIFALPPAEIAVHPSEGPDRDGGCRQELMLMCDDVAATLADLKAKGIQVEGEAEELRWGTLAWLLLPGGVRMGLYQPKHASPLPA